MAVQDKESIDIVAHDPKTDCVLLVMVETREWGLCGALLPELQDKLNTYLVYAIGGRLACDYPTYAAKPVRIELRSKYAPTPREQQFIDVVTIHDLRPRNIEFNWRLI